MRADAIKNYDHLLAVARAVVTDQGADASLRDIARRAGVGLGTLYRHFPTREALLEALLRTSFDALTARAAAFTTSVPPNEAIVAWLREVVAVAHSHRGVIALMLAAIADPNSALHASCVTMRSAGAQLLARAQAEGLARPDMDGDDLFSLAAALAWLGEQTSSEPRAEHLFRIITSAIVTDRSRSDGRAN